MSLVGDLVCEQVFDKSADLVDLSRHCWL